MRKFCSAKYASKHFLVFYFGKLIYYFKRNWSTFAVVFVGLASVPSPVRWERQAIIHREKKDSEIL
jgi:hypothetical protein